MDASPVNRPSAATSTSDDSSNRNMYQRRRQGGGSRQEAEQDHRDYQPTPIQAPDPNQPLYEALDRIRAIERPAEPEFRKTAKAVKAYEETERTARVTSTTALIRNEPPPVT